MLLNPGRGQVGHRSHGRGRRGPFVPGSPRCIGTHMPPEMTAQRHEIDLDVLYRAMSDQAVERMV
jgi:hypothetical protein